MIRPIAVLRPEPGNAATVDRIERAGRRAIALPLFGAEPLAWSVPDPTAFDAMILTSANAARLAGPGLAALSHLPVLAVGEATADAAIAAGLNVSATGGGDAQALAELAIERGVRAALHLAGQDHRALPPAVVRATVPVYRMAPLTPDLAPMTGAIALIHSPAAGARLDMLVREQGLDRTAIAVAAISDGAAAACGTGWAALAVAARPREAALLDAALALDD